TAVPLLAVNPTVMRPVSYLVIRIWFRPPVKIPEVLLEGAVGARFGPERLPVHPIVQINVSVSTQLETNEAEIDEPFRAAPVAPAENVTVLPPLGLLTFTTAFAGKFWNKRDARVAGVSVPP